MMAERAVQVLNHRNMGNRYVEVFLSSEAEMSQANVAPPAPTGGPWPMDANGGSMGAVGSNGIMRLRGLPFNATAELILSFFQGFDIPKGPHGVHLVLGPNGRPNGEAFVEFGNDEVADAALSKDRGTIGTRYVEVFRAIPEQMTLALQRVGKSNNLAPMQPMHAAHSMHQPPGYGYASFGMAPQMGFGAGMMSGMPGVDAVVKMRGLPYKVCGTRHCLDPRSPPPHSSNPLLHRPAPPPCSSPARPLRAAASLCARARYELTERAAQPSRTPP